jgi:hypothetical protein
MLLASRACAFQALLHLEILNHAKGFPGTANKWIDLITEVNVMLVNTITYPCGGFA